MANKYPPLGHKLGTIAHQAHSFQLRIDRIAQLAGDRLLKENNANPFQPRFIFEQNGRQRPHQFMGGTGHTLQDFGHIRQAVVRQMRQRAGAAVENALHVVQHGQDRLVLLVDVVEIEATGEVAVENFI